MGRPKEFDPETVLHAAETCFWRDGIHQTSISSLVEAMDIQRSSFYNSFKSRNAILETVLDRYLQTSPLSALATIPSDKSCEDHLIDVTRAYCEFLVNRAWGRGCLFLNGMSELTAQDGAAFELFHDRYTHLTENLARLVGVLAVDHREEADATTYRIHQLVALYIGLSHYSKLDQNIERLTAIGLGQLKGLSPVLSDMLAPTPNAVAGDDLLVRYHG